MPTYVIEARWGNMSKIGMRKDYVIEAPSVQSAKDACYIIAKDDAGIEPRQTVYVCRGESREQ